MVEFDVNCLGAQHLYYGLSNRRFLIKHSGAGPQVLITLCFNGNNDRLDANVPTIHTDILPSQGAIVVEGSMVFLQTTGERATVKVTLLD